MIDYNAIIIGGGPAGASCAWRLDRAGIRPLIIDKQTFPRTKLCAGWITPRVLYDLELDPADYPRSIVRFDRLDCYFKQIPIPIKTRQYAIRRYEFDEFLLTRARAEVHQHRVRKIRQENGYYIIDDIYRCRYLVGAGGTHCPVYRTFFSDLNPRATRSRIDTAEIEFSYDYNDKHCYLWFFDKGLPGYAWYVPKGNGYINIGIGGKSDSLRKRGATIREHWDRFARRLEQKQLVTRIPEPRGHIYYLRRNVSHVRTGNAFIAGDAVGLATYDMGEGIGPAVQSGLAAAESIITGRPYVLGNIPRMSFPHILRSALPDYLTCYLFSSKSA